MKKALLILSLVLSSSLMTAQQTMTPELLWQVKRLSVLGLDQDESTIFFKVNIPNIEQNDFDSKYYRMPVGGGTIVEINKEDTNAKDKNVSPDLVVPKKHPYQCCYTKTKFGKMTYDGIRCHTCMSDGIRRDVC